MIKKLIKKLIVKLWFIVPLFTKKSIVRSDIAKKQLSDFSPKPTGYPIHTNTICEYVCDLQIIVPAYNAEKYLEECLDSILTQKTKYTYKVVLIDDGSTDRTGEIADRYGQNEHILVIHQINKGFSGARNTGLSRIFAKYIMFVDSDDLLYPDAIESLMNEAVAHNSDIVGGGAIYLQAEKKGRLFTYDKTQTVPSALGVLRGEPWGKVFKAECFQNIIYPEGYWFEDTIFSFLIYPLQSRIRVSDQYAYVYRINEQGITATYKGKNKALDTYWVTEMLMQAHLDLQLPFDDLFLGVFLRQLIMNQRRLSSLPENIQESAFVLSAEMLEKFFSEELVKRARHKPLVRSLQTRNWRLYKFYCRYCDGAV